MELIKLDQKLAQILTHSQRPLASIAAVVFRDGHLLYEGYFGHRAIDPNNSARSLPVTRETKFRVASISKLVATLGVMQLVEKGLLALEDDVSNLLGFPLRNPHFPQTPITLAMLLSHTSSIRDGDSDNGIAYSLPLPHTVAEFFDPTNPRYADGAHWGGANQAPGSYFTYCNLNFGLVGTLIECASGQRFDRYMRAHVFDPLGLDASYNVRDFDDESISNVATLYRKQSAAGEWDVDGPWVAQVDDFGFEQSRGKRREHVHRVENPDVGKKPAQTHIPLETYTIGTNGTLFSPQGGLRISARDLATIGMLICNGGELNNNQLLRASSIQNMLTTRWRYDGTNGDAYGGLMQMWGLGTHFLHNNSSLPEENAPSNGDRLVKGAMCNWAGHAGDAYGLHSGLWLDPATKSGMVYTIGGIGADPALHGGAYSSFYRWEEEIATALCEGLQS